ncbi:hypothetical protein OG21DRAFT_1427151, partial [Imleria badia]
TPVVRIVGENAGLLLVICSHFIFASMDLSVKLLETLDPPTPTLELITLRMVITVCCCMIYMVANKISNPFLGPKGVRRLLFARAVSGFFGIFGIYYAPNYLSLADATVITFLGPFAIALTGHLLLGETYTKKEAIAGACGLIGVVLIARPPFLFGDTTEEDGDGDITSFERLRAVGAALIAVGGNTGTCTLTFHHYAPMHVMTFFAIFCVIVGFIAMATLRESIVFPMTWKWITLLFIIGFLSIAGQLLLTLGLRYETATRSALGSYSQLLSAVVLQLVVFGTVPSSLSTAGTVIIIVAQAYAVVSSYFCRVSSEWLFVCLFSSQSRNLQTNRRWPQVQYSQMMSKRD